MSHDYFRELRHCLLETEAHRGPMLRKMKISIWGVEKKRMRVIRTRRCNDSGDWRWRPTSKIASKTGCMVETGTGGRL
jgi:hypothetical protein